MGSREWQRTPPKGCYLAHPRVRRSRTSRLNRCAHTRMRTYTPAPPHIPPATIRMNARMPARHEKLAAQQRSSKRCMRNNTHQMTECWTCSTSMKDGAAAHDNPAHELLATCNDWMNVIQLLLDAWVMEPLAGLAHKIKHPATMNGRMPARHEEAGVYHQASRSMMNVTEWDRPTHFGGEESSSHQRPGWWFCRATNQQ